MTELVKVQMLYARVQILCGRIYHRKGQLAHAVQELEKFDHFFANDPSGQRRGTEQYTDAMQDNLRTLCSSSFACSCKLPAGCLDVSVRRRCCRGAAALV